MLDNAISEVSGKIIHVRHVEGPVSVQTRDFSNARIYTIGWQVKHFLKDEIALTYPWIEAQVNKSWQAG